MDTRPKPCNLRLNNEVEALSAVNREQELKYPLPMKFDAMKSVDEERVPVAVDTGERSLDIQAAIDSEQTEDENGFCLVDASCCL